MNLAIPNYGWEVVNHSMVQLRAESIQNRLTSHDSLYEETKWEKLKDRRNNHKLVLFHKMNYNKTPQYLADLIPKTVGTRHSHNTRQINNIVYINCRTSLYSEYFLPSTVPRGVHLRHYNSYVVSHVISDLTYIQHNNGLEL
jgi:hypothetical protein